MDPSHSVMPASAVEVPVFSYNSDIDAELESEIAQEQGQDPDPDPDRDGPIDIIGGLLRDTIPPRFLQNEHMVYFSPNLDIRTPGELLVDAMDRHRDHPTPTVCAMRSMSGHYERFDILCDDLGHFLQHYSNQVWVGSNTYHLFFVAPEDLLCDMWQQDRYTSMLEQCVAFDDDFMARDGDMEGIWATGLGSRLDYLCR